MLKGETTYGSPVLNSVTVMENVKLSFCPTLGEFICLHSLCQVVILRKNVVQHLCRKHKVPTARARKEAERVTTPFEGKQPHPIATRYLHQPIPLAGESALAALPGLRIYDIIQCEICSLFCRGFAALRSHMRSSHCSHEGLDSIIERLHMRPLLKGQTLFNGPQKRFFPVTIDSVPRAEGEKGMPKSPSIFIGYDDPRPPSCDNETLLERTANLSAKLLGIPDFLIAQKLTLEEAYNLTSVDDKALLSRLCKLLVTYVQHFAELNPPIPLSIIEALKIREAKTIASFSLRIKIGSKERYARVLARFIVVVSKLATLSHPGFQFTDALMLAAKAVIALPHPAKHPGIDVLQCIHSVCRELLLRGACASKGELLPLEALFKIVIAGYTCGVTSKRVRVGNSEDASHMAASLQYFCHLSALGEFLVNPVGFGGNMEKTDQERMDRVKQMLSTESYTPASFLRIVLLKTKHISAGEAPKVDFVPCRSHRYCGSVENIEVQMDSLSPGSLGYAVREIANDAKKIIRKDLMVNFKIPPSFSQIVLSFPDRYNERDPGYFFGSSGDAKRMMYSWADDFAKHLSQCPNAIIQQVAKDGFEQWEPTRHAAKWLHAVDKLSVLLYVLVHVCGGGPPRVTEMIDSKLRNTAGSRRNFFIINRCLTIIVVYSKTSEQFQKPKPIARFLDSQTTELLLLLIVYIKPIQGFLLKRTATGGLTWEDYIFCQSGHKFDDKDICREFARTLSSKGVPFNVSMYRHYRTGITKAFLSQQDSQSEAEVAFWQAGHSGATAQMRYAGGSFCFEDLSMSKLEGFHAVSLRWHMLLGLTESKASKGSIPPAYLRRETQKETGTVLELHQQIDERNEEDVRTVTKPPNLTPNDNLVLCKRTGRDRVPSGSMETKRQRTEIMFQTNPAYSSDFFSRTVLQSVGKILGLNEDSVRFKSAAQEAAVFESTMHTALTGYASSMLVILPTGGGKTLCWAAPALREQNLWDNSSIRPPLTIVVVPLIALQQDIRRKCFKYGIRFAKWDERFKNGVTVVVCSVDRVFTNDYKNFVTAIFAQGRLARLVVDEVHLLLQWKKLRKFDSIGNKLRPDEVKQLPLLLMSATITCGMISELQGLLNLNLSCFKVSRAAYTRPNICYEVLYVECVRMEDMIQKCAAIIDALVSLLAPKDRIIAYCLTIKESMRLHHVLNGMKSGYEVCVYHGRMTDGERTENFDKWVNKDSNVPAVIACTSAFSCGVDYDHVRNVVHVGGTRSVVELAQESGRLGRDGKAAKNTVVYNEQYLDNRMRTEDSETTLNSRKSSYGDIKAFVNRNGCCRRMILESFLNDTNRGPCVGEEAKCDICLRATFSVLHPKGIHSSNLSRINDRPSSTMPRRSRVLAPLSIEGKLRSSGNRCLVFGFDKSDAMWKAKQIARSKCAVCLFAMNPTLESNDHSRCMRGMCYRCVEKGANHQSSKCLVTPRSSTACFRCFFCGIPQSEDLHEPGTFSKANKCLWSIAKDLALLCWWNDKYRPQLCAAVPSLRGCISIADVGSVLCGSDHADEKAELARAVGFLYKEFVLRSNT